MRVQGFCVYTRVYTRVTSHGASLGRRPKLRIWLLHRGYFVVVGCNCEVPCELRTTDFCRRHLRGQVPCSAALLKRFDRHLKLVGDGCGRCEVLAPKLIHELGR